MLFGCALAVACSAAAKGGRNREKVGDWRALLSSQDRARLRNWRESWIKAVADARQHGAAGQIAGEGALLDPDAANGSDAPPPGAYRCRTVKVGSLGPNGIPFVANPWLSCRIDGGHFATLSGSQRPIGDLHRDDAGRLVFVGAIALGDEQGAFAYGRDDERDMVGIVEQIGPRRWRMVIPQPRWESQLDVTEIVPAG